MRIDPIMEAGLHELGVQTELDKVRLHQGGYESQCKLLEEAKAVLKRRYRELARTLHPDANSNIPPEERQAREDRLKGITRAMEFVAQVKVVHRPPPIMQPFRVYPIHLAHAWSDSSTTNSTTTSTGGTWRIIIQGV